jgi:hypothetical protein
MVRPERFELPTCCSGGNRSIQLSYGRNAIRTVYTAGPRSLNVDTEPPPLRGWTDECVRPYMSLV